MLFILSLSGKRLVYSHKFWKLADFVYLSAKLSTTQFVCNLAFKWHSDIPAHPADDHPRCQQNCPYPRDSSGFCTFVCLPTATSLTSLTSPFLHVYSLPSVPLFSHLLSRAALCIYLQYNVTAVWNSTHLCDLIHLMLSKQFNDQLC